MATDALPAIPSLSDLGLPEGLSDLEGWSEAELVAWATTAGRRIAQGESLLEQMRLCVGLVLWKLRQEAGDGRYGLLVAEMAEQLGYSVRTLQGWRSDAQAHYALPAPDARSAGQQRAANARGSAHPAPAPHGIAEKITPSEVIPPEPERRREKRADSIGSDHPAPRHEQLALPLEEASLAIRMAPLDELVALDPGELDAMALRIAEAQRAQRRLSGKVAAAACSHPKAMHKTLAYATICDQAKGGCGAKVR
jgi:hypothetical protein